MTENLTTSINKVIKDNVILVIDQDQYLTIKNIQKTIPENEKVIAEQNAEITKLKDEVLSLQNEVKMLTEHKEEVISASEKLKEARRILLGIKSEEPYYNSRRRDWQQKDRAVYDIFIESLSNIETLNKACDSLILQYKRYIESDEYKHKEEDINNYIKRKTKEADDYYSKKTKEADNKIGSIILIAAISVLILGTIAFFIGKGVSSMAEMGADRYYARPVYVSYKF